VYDLANVLGVISPGGKEQFPELQGADFVSHTTFLAEQHESIDLTDLAADGNVNSASKISGRNSPDFRCHIDANLLATWHRRMIDLQAERMAFGQQKKLASAATLAAE
jgi:hypothetical protein